MGADQLDQTQFADENLDAIAADGLRVGTDIFFGVSDSSKNKFEAKGSISLINARVGGDFSCDGAILSFPGEEPLAADGILVEGTTFLTEILTDGVLRFVQADLKQGFYLRGATFDTTKGCNSWTKEHSNTASVELGGPSCGIFAPDANVGGAFQCKEVKKIEGDGVNRTDPNTFWLFICGSKANQIEDDQLSWAALVF